MYKFKNILVPFDGSEAARRALDAAIGIAGDDAVVTVLQASDGPGIGDPTAVVASRMAGVVRSESQTEEEIASFWDTIETTLSRIAEDALADSGKQVTVNTAVVEGVPAAVITGFANENGSDLIVMGRRGLGSVRAMLGSVSQRVAHETDLPLLLVK